MPSNKIAQPLILLLASLFILALLSSIPVPPVWGYEFRPVNLLADLEKDTASQAAPVEAQKDSVPVPAPVVKQDPTAIIDNANDSGLIHLFTSLNEVKNKKGKTRIAWFGDSFIEGDLITQDFRSLMQDEFGGYGVGYVPVTSNVAGFRQSVIHSFDGWQTVSIVDDVPPAHKLGIAGYTFIPDTNTPVNEEDPKYPTWVKYTAVNAPHLNAFSTVKLLYGNSHGDNSVKINGSVYDLNHAGAANTLEVSSGANIQSVLANFNCKSAIDVYGFSLESEQGVIVDNYSFRGNSGLALSKVPQNVYQGLNASLNYDLIILEYGLNAISAKAKDYDWYARGMLYSIQYIKACFPNADVLIIGLGDKAIRVKGHYVEDPSIAMMLEIQKNLAIKTKCSFWSLYDAMGGEGSMIKWADADTALANKDYTHLNFRGAKKAGTMFYEKLMEKYNTYNSGQPVAKW